MNKYKLIACDLDGTLVGSDMKLSEENYTAIKELTNMGIQIVPATGRTLCEMEDVVNLSEIRYVIYSNGAGIYDKKTNETIFMGLDEDSTRFVCDTIEKYDALAVIHKDGKTYADKKKAQNVLDYNVNFNVEYLVKNCCIQDEKFRETFLSGGIESLSVFFKNQEEQKECFDIISSNPKLYAVEGFFCNMEIFCKDAGKGSALKILAENLGIEMEDVISIGDSDNDKQMTLMAGLGLACENACDSLKKVADKIICTNDEHVIRYVQKNYFNSEEV